MTACPVVSKLTWRINYLILLVICAGVIMWITSLSESQVKMRMQVPPSAEVQKIKKEPVRDVEMETVRDVEQQEEVEEVAITLKDLCPEKSPLLREFYCKITLTLLSEN